MKYNDNQIVTAKVIKVKEYRVNVCLPNGETTAMYAGAFCDYALNLKLRFNIGDEFLVKITGYDEKDKPIVNIRELLCRPNDAVDLLTTWDNSGRRRFSNSFYATVIGKDHGFYYTEVFPGIRLKLKRQSYRLEMLDKVLLSFTVVCFGRKNICLDKLDCLLEHIPTEKNYRLNNFAYRPEAKFETVQ